MKFFLSIMIIISTVHFSFAGEKKLTIEDAWTRPVVLENRPSAVYFTINNEANEPDKLIKVVSALAKRIEMHTHKNQDGVMKMIQVKDIPVAANSKLKVEPGGYHLMVFGLSMKFSQGDEFPLVLKFANAGRVPVVAKVMKKAPTQMDHSNHMDHSKM